MLLAADRINTQPWEFQSDPTAHRAIWRSLAGIARNAEIQVQQEMVKFQNNWRRKKAR